MKRDYKRTTRFRKFKVMDHRRRAGSFQNPLFTKRAEKINKIKRLKSKIIIVLILAVVLVLFYFIFVSSYFYINFVKVDGLQSINSSDFKNLLDDFLCSRRLLIIPNQNILFSNIGDLRKEIGEKYVLDDLSIKRKFPSKLLVTIQERTPKAVLSNGPDYYFVDQQGIILRRLTNDEVFPGQSFGPFQNQAPQYEQKDFGLPLIYLESGSQLSIGAGFLSQDYFEKILGSQELVSLHTPYQVKFFKLKDEQGNWYKIVTMDNWEIHLSLDKNIQTQIVKLYTFIREEGLNPAAYDYFNVRFEDRIYYQ